MLGFLAGMMGKKAIGGAIGKTTGVAGVALKWPLLIAVAVWNILDSILGIFIKSPLWVFLILMLLDALINIVLIIMIINMRSIFKLWIWDLILFGWASLSTLLNIMAGWWLLEWIVDPLLMVACCFLVALMPFDNVGGGGRGQYAGEEASAVSVSASGGNRRTAAKRDSAGAVGERDSGNGVTINIGSVSTDPMERDRKKE